ncbi:MAG: Rid family detoxifying hydrolase [Elusimicrobiales bacterium]|nr:Rid family detoxifying hydrolase [Elusimicrobiales bacterium]
MKKSISVDNAPKAIGPYSQAIETENLIFISGQLPLDLSGNIPSSIKEQTINCIKNIENILKGLELNLKNVVKTTVFMTDLTKFQEMNEVYSEFFSSNPPARSTVEVKGLPKGASIEIEAIAIKNI